MDEGKILLINLSKGRLGEDNSTLLGAILVGKLLIAALSRAELPVEKRRHFHLIVDEYHSFATESFPTLQSEARKFGIDTIVAHQYRQQLDLLNVGSTLNVGNFVLFRTTGPDARELALQFDNCPPDPELELKTVPRRTGREGIFRSSGDSMLMPGTSRTYSDVENETANQLANNPNYHAYCKLIEGGALEEHYIQTRKGGTTTRLKRAKDIREQSQRLAMRRADIEKRISELWPDEESRAYRSE